MQRQLQEFTGSFQKYKSYANTTNTKEKTKEEKTMIATIVAGAVAGAVGLGLGYLGIYLFTKI